MSGEGLLGVYQVPGDAKAAVFCHSSSLFRAEWPDGKVIGIRLGTLDTDPEVGPQCHIFVDSRAAWDALPEDGLPRYATRPG